MYPLIFQALYEVILRVILRESVLFVLLLLCKCSNDEMVRDGMVTYEAKIFAAFASKVRIKAKCVFRGQDGFLQRTSYRHARRKCDTGHCM